MEAKHSFNFEDIDSPTMIVINRTYNSVTENSFNSSLDKQNLIPTMADQKLITIEKEIPRVKEVKIPSLEKSSENSHDSIEISDEQKENLHLEIDKNNESDHIILDDPTADTRNHNINIKRAKFQSLLQVIHKNCAIDFYQALVSEKSKNLKKSFCEKLCLCCVTYDTIDWKAFNQLVVRPISKFPQPGLDFTDFLSDSEPNQQFFLGLHEKIDEIRSNMLKGPSSGLSIHLLYFYKQRFPYHISKISRRNCDDLPEKWSLSVTNAVELVKDNKKNRTKHANGITGVLFRGFVVYFTEICLENSKVKKSLEVIESNYEKIEYNETLELD